MTPRNNLLLDPGGKSDRLAIGLDTRRGNHIRNERRRELPLEVLIANKEISCSAHPQAEVRSVTATYNCVGMVFASRRTWVDPDQVRKILSDDGYQRVGGIEQAEVGDVVLYIYEGEIAHVGIIIERRENLREASISFKVLSKWGAHPEFIHHPDDVSPLWGELTEVWTDRKVL